MMIFLFLAYLLSWILCRFLCEYKYFFCKGNCKKCYNWKCKFYKNEDKKNG